MNVTDWRQMCKEENDIEVNGNEVIVKCSDERRHRILIRETEDAYELTAIVAHPALLRGIENVSLRAWQRNRSMQLLGFRLDNRGRLVGETWAPKAGLTRGEFLLLIRRLAAECDHFEYHLTGKDEE